MQFLAWRRLRQEWSFEGAPVITADRFFTPEVMAALHDQECFLDAGAHHGGVLETFLEQTHGAFRQIIAVEAGPGPSSGAATARCSALLPGDPRVAIHDCALADRDGDMLFHDGLGYASQLSPTGKLHVSTRRIDALGFAPSFVKLHLEGAEFAALRGARQHLDRLPADYRGNDLS